MIRNRKVHKSFHTHSKVSVKMLPVIADAKNGYSTLTRTSVINIVCSFYPINTLFTLVLFS